MKAKALTALLLGPFLLSACFLTTTSKGSIPTTPTSSVVSDNSKDGVLGKLIENLSNQKTPLSKAKLFPEILSRPSISFFF